MGLLSAHSAEKTAPLVEYVIIPSQKSPFDLEIQDSPDKLRLVTKYPVVKIDCLLMMFRQYSWLSLVQE